MTQSDSPHVICESGIFPVPSNASKTVYVEGLPADATEREVAHIFRPFPGYRTLRLVPREKRQGERTLICFADFATPVQSTVVINTLQGYRFDREDSHGLYFSYATAPAKQEPKNVQPAFAQPPVPLPAPFYGGIDQLQQMPQVGQLPMFNQ